MVIKKLTAFVESLIIDTEPAVGRYSSFVDIIGVLKNFAIFTEKHLCCSLFLIKLLVRRPATLLKRDSNTSVFL